MANDTYGLTTTGVNIPSVDDLRANTTQLMQVQFNQSLPLGDDTALGFLVGVTAEQVGLAWQFGQAVWSGMDPNAATGAGLDNVSLLSGTFRAQPTASVATISLCGTNGTVVSNGSAFTTASTGARFATNAAVTLNTLTSWAVNTATVLGAQVTNSGQCYQCTVAGTTNSVGSGPVVTSGTTTDGTVTWAWIGTGAASASATAVCTVTGIVPAVSGDLTVIANPIGGLNTCFNLLDAVEGTNVMSDQALRLLRTEELAATGTGTGNAIRAALLQLTGVTFAAVYYNITSVTDSNGTPPNSIQALVVGGSTSDIVNCLYSQVGAGIATFGSSSGTLLDSQGVTQTLFFDRPTSFLMYIRVVLTYDITQYPGDVSAQLAIATAGNARSPGTDVVPSAFVSALFAGVAGIQDVSQVMVYNDVIGVPVAWAASTSYVATPGSRSVVTVQGRSYICIGAGTSASSGSGPTGIGAVSDGSVVWEFLGTTFVIGPLSVAQYDTSRITIQSSAGTL